MRRARRRATAALLLLPLLVPLAACASNVPGSGAGMAASPPATGPSAPSPSRDPLEVAGPVGESEDARVVRVVDGDTIVVDRGRGEERVRYIGIDTPESVRPGTPVEDLALEASGANATLVDGRDVVLERDVSETDRHGRLLRYVWLREADGWQLVNLQLVRRGFAHAVTYPPDVRHGEAFRAAERAARDEGIGLWAAGSPASPTPTAEARAGSPCEAAAPGVCIAPPPQAWAARAGTGVPMP